MALWADLIQRTVRRIDRRKVVGHLLCELLPC